MFASYPRWRARLTRARAEAIFLLRAVRALSLTALALVVVTVLGAVVQHVYGAQPGHPPPSWEDAFFISYCLLLLEHLDRAPPHPLAQLVHYVQPFVGVLLVGEGLTKLGINLFRKQANARAWIEIMAKASRGHVILCGLGSVGFRILEELSAMQVPVFVVERNPDGAFVARARELGTEILIGDARAEGLLRSLNVLQARAVIVATDDDLANLEIAMDIREMSAQVPIVLRLFDQRLAQRVRATLGIEVSVSTSKLAAPLFATAALDRTVVNTHKVGDRTLVVMELRACGALAGRSAAELSRRHSLTVVGTTRGGSTWEVPPDPDRKLDPQDRIQVLVDGARIEEIRALGGEEA